MVIECFSMVIEWLWMIIGWLLDVMDGSVIPCLWMVDGYGDGY